MSHQSTLDYLFPLAGHDQYTLHQQLDRLRESLHRTDNLPNLAQQYLTSFPTETTYALAIVGSDPASLHKQINRAQAGLIQAFEQTGEWRAPAGSYFTTQPLGQKGQVAFVYPGAMNSYVGLGRDLFRLFPGLLAKLARVTNQVSQAIRQPLTQPANFETLSKTDRQQLTDQLLADPAAMLETGTSFAILFTKIMQDYFGLQPAMAFGYSLGESSMLWSLGVWSDGDAGSVALNEFPLFQHPSTWHNYALTIPAAEAEAIIQTEPQVELSIINTAREVIIAGEPAACERVIERLDCSAIALPFNLAMHCSAVQPAYQQLVDLYHRPIRTVPDIEFYSAAHYDQLPLDPTSISQAIAHMLCHPLDFPRLLNRVYNAGARLFIELGPGRTCTRWIGDNLADREHTAIAINKAGSSDRTNIIRLLARLISHRLPLDLTPLLGWIEAEENSLSLSSPAYDQLGEHLTEVNQLQVEFLQYRKNRLQELSWLIKQQLDALVGELNSFQLHTPSHSTIDQPRQPLAFNEYQLQQFATGSIAQCFGPAYNIYEHRRGPRIPNGDLRLINRVMSVDQADEVVAQCDLPSTNELLISPPPAGSLPYFTYMEMALQACGFLSVYLGAALQNQKTDLYYRNLDGQSTLFKTIFPNNQPLTTKAKLISSTTMRGIIIEKFSFEIREQSTKTIFQGYTTFGYFNRRALANQVGLGGSLTVRWDDKNLQLLPGSLYSADSRLNLLTEVYFQPAAGDFGRGYVVGRQKITPDDWFFANHFYQDPVMPGSLGVEAVLQAMQRYVVAYDLGRHLRLPQWSHRLTRTTRWQYRGQITPETDYMIVEVHLKETLVSPAGVILTGDGYVWRVNPGEKPLRIYIVQDAAICLEARKLSA